MIVKNIDVRVPVLLILNTRFEVSRTQKRGFKNMSLCVNVLLLCEPKVWKEFVESLKRHLWPTFIIVKANKIEYSKTGNGAEPGSSAREKNNSYRGNEEPILDILQPMILNTRLTAYLEQWFL